MEDTSSPAFPSTLQYFPEDTFSQESEGMSLRDYFAAHAPNPPENWRKNPDNLFRQTEWRWYYADAMLKTREM